MENNKKFIIVLKKKFILVFLLGRLFLKQYYVHNDKVDTLFYVLYTLYVLGFWDNKDLLNVFNKNIKNVYI
jgi:hypothetical protein